MRSFNLTGQFGSGRGNVFSFGSPLDRILSLPWSGKSGLWLPALGSFANAALDPAISNVGLVLDQSRGVRASGGKLTGLGPELVVNGDFASGYLTGWDSSGFTIVDGRARSPEGNGSLSQSIPVVVGRNYLIHADVYSASGGDRLSANLLGAPKPLAHGAQDLVVTASRTDIQFTSYSSPANYRAAVTNISVREIPSGIGPLTQPSEALKPGLSGGALGFDGLQSTMSVDLPGGGSSDCDVLVWLSAADPMFVVLSRSGAFGYMLAVHSTDTLTSISKEVGNHVALGIDGTAFSGSTRSDLHSVLADSSIHIARLSNVDLSAWGGLKISGHGGAWNLDGQIGGLAIWDNTASGPLTAQQIDMMDRYVKGLVT